MNITIIGKAYKLEGKQPEVGALAPDFQVKNEKDEIKTLESFGDKVIIISVVPDIDTRVCAIQTRQFNKTASELEDVKLITISNNTKKEQANWCAAEGVSMEMLHDTELNFANAYGVFMPELEKLARSVFVISAQNKLVYKEIVPDMSDEPQYNQAIKAAIEAHDN